MNKLSRILSIMLCFAPVAYASAGPVATTTGSNLTAFNPSNAMNNQWATMSNGRYDGNTSAKADFGNCNSLILRCAQPKCANGGCSDMSVASAIVAGCVQSNKSCAQYGNDLVQYMSAQLVASSNAKINEQNAAAQQAAAQAAQQAAAQQSAQQAQQMQQMQAQMQQMQQQMAQQQAESAQQLQNALAQQAAQSAAAIENMRSAATEAAMQTESGLTSYEQEAIQRGISEDVLERKKITGQIMTEIENSEASLKEVKNAINAAFEYAKCDARGNNCEGPKRVKKWRELALVFLTPYDNAIDKLYDALELAQLVGVDLSDIYMMLNNSCNRWGQYICPKMVGGHVEYQEKGAPQICPNGSSSGMEVELNCFATCKSDFYKNANDRKKGNMTETQIEEQCKGECLRVKPAAAGDCKPCTFLKMLSNGEDVYEGWVFGDQDTSSNTTVVACASGALDSSKLFARRTKNKNGAGLVDIDQMDTWLNQKEPTKKLRGSGPTPMDYCNADGHQEALEKSMLSKMVPTKNYALCVSEIRADGTTDIRKEDKDECGYISPVYAICDTHLYNVGKKSAADTLKSGENTSNCTSDTRKDEYQNNDRIVWAKKRTVDNTEKCEVELCQSGWKPVLHGITGKLPGCEKDDNYKLDCENCDYNKKLESYRNEVLAGYGETKEMIALKTTVISQQMYKQYEYLNATIRRLKTQLEKAVYKSQLEAAGAKNEDGSSSSGLLGGGNSAKSSQYTNCSGKDEEGTLYCLRQNYSALSSRIESKKCQKAEKDQLSKDVKLINGLLATKVDQDKNCDFSGGKGDCAECLSQYNIGLINIKKENDEREFKLRGWGK